MVIECHICHARFRLDGSMIKGRGARVKCRKCGGSILVLKDSASAPAPPPSGGEGSFDLGSAVRDSIGERSASPLPPAGNLIPFPAPVRTAEPTGPETPLPPRAATPPDEPGEASPTLPEKDEVDLAFEQFLPAGGTKDPLPSTGETETEGPAPLDATAPTLDFTPEETLDLPPAEAGEPPAGELPPEETAAGSRGEEEFLANVSESFDFPKEEPAVPRSEAPPRFDDISLAISSAPAEEWSSFPLEGNVTPPSTPVMEVPPQPEAKPAPAIPSELPEQRISPAPEPLRVRSSAGIAAAVVLAILLAAGGYLGFTASGKKMIERAVPGVAALWGEKPGASTESKYDLRNVIGYYESGDVSPRILVIKGQVANLSGTEKSGIRVHAALLDNADAVLLQQVVYAGNMLSGETIRKADRETLTKVLGNRFGEGLANMHVAPGKSIPFMVVFFDAPVNFENYKLEAKDGE